MYSCTVFWEHHNTEEANLQPLNGYTAVLNGSCGVPPPGAHHTTHLGLLYNAINRPASLIQR